MCAVRWLVIRRLETTNGAVVWSRTTLTHKLMNNIGQCSSLAETTGRFALPCSFFLRPVVFSRALSFFFPPPVVFSRALSFFPAPCRFLSRPVEYGTVKLYWAPPQKPQFSNNPSSTLLNPPPVPLNTSGVGCVPSTRFVAAKTEQKRLSLVWY